MTIAYLMHDISPFMPSQEIEKALEGLKQETDVTEFVREQIAEIEGYLAQARARESSIDNWWE